MNIKEYIYSQNILSKPKDYISIVLYNTKNNTHLYLFDFENDEYGNLYCSMINEPINKELPYTELSLPFIDIIDEYYPSYSPIKHSKDIGKHYKTVLKRLKAEEQKLLKLQQNASYD